MDNAFKYIEEIGGLDTEDAYVSFFMVSFPFNCDDFIYQTFIYFSHTTHQMKYYIN